MILSLLGSLFGGIWSVLKAIPLRVWLVLAIAGGLYFYHSHAVSTARTEGVAAGTKAENAKWEQAQKDAKEKADREAKEQQAKIDKEAAASKEAADKRIATAKAETESLREKLRHANQPKPGAPPGVPSDCRISPERRDLLNQALGYD